MQERTPTIGADKSTVHARIRAPANLASPGSYSRTHGNTRINQFFFIHPSLKRIERKKRSVKKKKKKVRDEDAASRRVGYSR